MNTRGKLLSSGQVVELDECEVAVAKDKLNPKPFIDFYSKEETEKRKNITEENEKRLRGL